jgi:hypothetical protein
VPALDSDAEYRWSRSWPNSDYASGQKIGLDEDRMVHVPIYFATDIDVDAGPGKTIVTSSGPSGVLLETLRPSSGDW